MFDPDKRISAALAWLPLFFLACADADRDPYPASIRLLPGGSNAIPLAGELGDATTVFDVTFRDPIRFQGWRPVVPGGSWTSGPRGLAIDAIGGSFALERETGLDAAGLHALEVTVASSRRIESRLGWRRAGDSAVGAHAQSVSYDQGRGPADARVLTFDLTADAAWSGVVSELRLDFELPLPDAVEVLRLRGLRYSVAAELREELARRVFRVELDHEVRSVLLLHPEHPFERVLELPRDAELRFAVGASGRLATPMSFRVALEDAAGTFHRLFETTLEPASRTAERRWRDERIDLSPFGGQRVRLIAESRAGTGFDAALGLPAWAQPEIVVPGRAEHPSIILISVDTLRADRLSLYGYPRPTSPRIDAWARRRAAVFEYAVAPAPWTLPSHVSLLSGLDAVRHGVNRPFTTAPSRLVSIAERLRAAGYRTAALTGGGWLHPSYGLAQGFDRFRYWPLAGRGDLELERHVELAGRWLAELPRPFFLFLHTNDVHDYPVVDRRADPGETPNRQDLYERSVVHMDEHLGRLLAGLEAGRGPRAMMTILTSDHGEELGEDGHWGHGSLREPLLRVPLLVALPDGAGAGRAVTAQARLVDVAPTLLAAAGLAPDAGLDGVSLLPAIAGTGEALPPLASSYFSSPEHGLALRLDNRLKYTFNNAVLAPGYGREGLYRLLEDPGARRDLAASDPETPRLREAARRLLARLPGLRLTLHNAAAAPLEGRLHGGLVRLENVKSSDLPCPCLSPDGRYGARFKIPPGTGFHLLFEEVHRAVLEIVVGIGGEPPTRWELDLARVSLPLVLRHGEDGWRREGGRAGPGETVLELAWQGAAGIAGDPPFEPDPELARQLRALGYLAPD